MQETFWTDATSAVRKSVAAAFAGYTDWWDARVAPQAGSNGLLTDVGRRIIDRRA